MSSLVIRSASLTDVSSLVKIRLGAINDKEATGFTVPGEGLYSSIEKLREMWDRENLLKDGCEVFVAERDARVIGFIVYNIKSSDDNIDNLIIAKEEQGKGVGRALVEFVEELAKSRGCDVIKTDTTENAEGVPWKAYGFWLRLDYEDTGERVATKYGFKDIPLVKKLK